MGGLGKNKQGREQHVKTKYKNDTKGIGHRHSQNNEMFQATMCMFNDILSGLNKKKSANSLPPKSKSSNKHLSASAVIKSYEAKHHLYGKFRAAKNISARSEEEKNQLFGIDDERGFTERDQTNYAMQMNALSMTRSGKMGLGFGANDEQMMDVKQLTFGKFMKSGSITKDDLINENVGGEDGKKAKKKKKKKEKMEDMNIAIDDGIKKKKKKKKKKSKKRKLEDEDGMIGERVTKKMKMEKKNVIGDNMSDISSSASILSTNPTPIQSDEDNVREEKITKQKKKKDKSKKKKKDKIETKHKSEKKKKSKKKDKSKKKKKKTDMTKSE